MTETGWSLKIKITKWNNNNNNFLLFEETKDERIISFFKCVFYWHLWCVSHFYMQWWQNVLIFPLQNRHKLNKTTYWLTELECKGTLNWPYVISKIKLKAFVHNSSKQEFYVNRWVRNVFRNFFRNFVSQINNFCLKIFIISISYVEALIFVFITIHCCISEAFCFHPCPKCT